MSTLLAFVTLPLSAVGMISGALFSLTVRLVPGEDAVSTTVGWIQQRASLGQLAVSVLVARAVNRNGSLIGLVLARQFGQRSRA
jgi:hypothetical protein